MITLENLEFIIKPVRKKGFKRRSHTEVVLIVLIVGSTEVRSILGFILESAFPLDLLCGYTTEIILFNLLKYIASLLLDAVLPYYTHLVI